MVSCRIQSVLVVSLLTVLFVGSEPSTIIMINMSDDNMNQKKKNWEKKDENDKRIDLNGEDELVSGTRIMSIVDG